VHLRRRPQGRGVDRCSEPAPARAAVAVDLDGGRVTFDVDLDGAAPASALSNLLGHVRALPFRTVQRTPPLPNATPCASRRRPRTDPPEASCGGDRAGEVASR